MPAVGLIYTAAGDERRGGGLVQEATRRVRRCAPTLRLTR